MQTLLTCVTAEQHTVPDAGRRPLAARQRYCASVRTEGLGELRVEETSWRRVSKQRLFTSRLCVPFPSFSLYPSFTF